MEKLFNNINVNYSEYSYFKQLSIADKASFLFQLYENAQNINNANGGPDLSQFFKTIIEDKLADSTNDYISETYEAADYATDPNRVDVLIDDSNIMLESNSLKAVRQIIYKFIEAGYILRRDLGTEKLFRRDKITRYLRIFYIIDQTSHICIN